MKYYVEDSLDNFEAWSGGKDTLETLREKGDVDSVECLIEELASTSEEGWTDTNINDFLWFERDMIAEHLGYSSWEEYEYGKSEDEEDEETEWEDKALNSCWGFYGEFDKCENDMFEQAGLNKEEFEEEQA